MAEHVDREDINGHVVAEHVGREDINNKMHKFLGEKVVKWQIQTILFSQTQLCFYLKATCFGLDTNHQPATKYTTMKRHIKNSVHKTLRFL